MTSVEIAFIKVQWNRILIRIDKIKFKLQANSRKSSTRAIIGLKKMSLINA